MKTLIIIFAGLILASFGNSNALATRAAADTTYEPVEIETTYTQGGPIFKKAKRIKPGLDVYQGNQRVYTRDLKGNRIAEGGAVKVKRKDKNKVGRKPM